MLVSAAPWREVKLDIKEEADLAKQELEADKLAEAKKIQEAIEKYFQIIKKRGFLNTGKIEKKIYALFSISDEDFKLILKRTNIFRNYILENGYIKKDQENLKALEIHNFYNPYIQNEAKLRLQMTIAKFRDTYVEKDNDIVKKKLESLEKGFPITEATGNDISVIPGLIREKKLEAIGNFLIGMASYKGSNPHKAKEDCTTYGQFECRFKEGNKKVTYAAVLDGHGGKECAEYFAFCFKFYLEMKFKDISHKFESEMENAFNQLFLDLEERWINRKQLTSGTTFSAAIFIEGTGEVWFINIGDSRIIYSNKGKAIQYTEDPSPANPKFMEECMDRGGIFLTHPDEEEPRLYGILDMTESLGDFFLCDKDTWVKVPGLSSKPHVVRKKLEADNEDQFIVLLTDGVHYYKDSKDICEFIQKSTASLSDIAVSIVEDAYLMGSNDDATVLIIKPEIPH